MSDLRSPLWIKGLQLKNRLVMPPMALDIASETGEVTAAIINHYMARAQAKSTYAESPEGLGLIIVEHCYVNKEGKAHPRQLGIYDDSLIPGLTQLATQIHNAGVAVGLQLSHAGARGLSHNLGPSSIPVPFLKRFTGTNSPNYAFEKQTIIPEQMGKKEILKLIEDFALGAERVKTAGFDLVEIHGAHGYILNQFLSPLTNHRNDEYGGSLVNRLRIPIAILEAIRGAVGNDFPVFYRLGADDRMLGGIQIEEGVAAAKYLEKAGVDCLDLSGGIGGYMSSGQEGYFCYMADAIKSVTSVPVLLTGGIKTAVFGNRMISEGHADLIGIGRALLADPNWVNRPWQ